MANLSFPTQDLFASLAGAKKRVICLVSSPMFVENPTLKILPICEPFEREFNRCYKDRFDFATFASNLRLPTGSYVQLMDGSYMGGRSAFDLHVTTKIHFVGRALALKTRLLIPKNPDVRKVELALMSIKNPWGGYASGKGIGTKVFSNLVNALAELGFCELRADAHKGVGYNGYYTWPRLGFDRKLTQFEKDSFLICDRTTESADVPQTMLDLMSSSAGRRWWRRAGYSHDVQFDLAPHSRGHQVLSAYLREKRL